MGDHGPDEGSPIFPLLRLALLIVLTGCTPQQREAPDRGPEESQVSVQVVENWVDVRGQLLDWRASESVAGHVELDIEVESLAPVEGFPNLFEGREGETITVLARESLLDAEELAPGAEVECRIRRAGPAGAYVHPELCRVAR